MLKLVCYINDKEYIDQTKQFDEYDFSIVSEAERIKANKRNLESKKREAEAYEGKKIFNYRYRTRTAIPELKEEDIIGNEKDVDDLLKNIMMTDSEEWEDGYLYIVKELDNYEKRLDEFGDSLVESYRENEQYEEISLDTDPEDKIEELVEREEKAAEDMLQITEIYESEFNDKLKMANQIEKIKIDIRNSKNESKYDAWKRFFPVFASAVLAVTVPYFVMQPYIVSGVFSGNVVPLICIGVFIVSFILAKKTVAVIRSIRLKKASKQLESILTIFLISIEKRQRLFIKRLNAIVSMQNIRSERNVLADKLKERNDIYSKIMYHKEQIEKHLKAMEYFKNLTSDCDNRMIAAQYKNDLVENIELGTEENDIYWMKQVETE